jgi:hypothetical protein
MSPGRHAAKVLHSRCRRGWGKRGCPPPVRARHFVPPRGPPLPNRSLRSLREGCWAGRCSPIRAGLLSLCPPPWPRPGGEIRHARRLSARTEGRGPERRPGEKRVLAESARAGVRGPDKAYDAHGPVSRWVSEQPQGIDVERPERARWMGGQHDAAAGKAPYGIRGMALDELDMLARGDVVRDVPTPLIGRGRAPFTGSRLSSGLAGWVAGGRHLHWIPRYLAVPSRNHPVALTIKAISRPCASLRLVHEPDLLLGLGNDFLQSSERQAIVPSQEQDLLFTE